jgi:methanogenic corrinoid protein MtbC1
LLPELILAADTMKVRTAICQAQIPKAKLKAGKKAVVGTVKGDIHDIRKSIVVSFLIANGENAVEAVKKIKELAGLS